MARGGDLPIDDESLAVLGVEHTGTSQHHASIAARGLVPSGAGIVGQHALGEQEQTERRDEDQPPGEPWKKPSAAS